MWVALGRDQSQQFHKSTHLFLLSLLLERSLFRSLDKLRDFFLLRSRLRDRFTLAARSRERDLLLEGLFFRSLERLRLGREPDRLRRFLMPLEPLRRRRSRDLERRRRSRDLQYLNGKKSFSENSIWNEGIYLSWLIDGRLDNGSLHIEIPSDTYRDLLLRLSFLSLSLSNSRSLPLSFLSALSLPLSLAVQLTWVSSESGGGGICVIMWTS